MPEPAVTTSDSQLAMQVVNHIRLMIERGELQPGDKIPPEREFARHLKISRASLRTGIGYLAAMGGMKVRHGVGTFVADGPPASAGWPISIGPSMIAIRTEFSEARIIMLTTFEGDVEIQRALEAGARGYMLKSMPPHELVEVIRQVHLGRKRVPAEVASHLAEHMSDETLTLREIDVLRHIAGGNRNRDVADRLFISEETVKVHVKHIMEKLGASDRTQAVAIAVRRGIIQL